MVAGYEVVKELYSDIISVVGSPRLEGSDRGLSIDSVVVEEVWMLVENISCRFLASLLGKGKVSLGAAFVGSQPGVVMKLKGVVEWKCLFLFAS